MAIRRRDEVFTSEMDDTLLMLSLEQGRYFSLEGVGPRIWALLEQPTSPTALIDRLSTEFDVSRAVCEAEVTHFLDALSAHQLLVEVD